MALTWNAVQKVYSPDALEFLALAERLGLQWSLDVFEQLFIARHDDAEFGGLVRVIDWSTIEWNERRISGIALRRVGVPRIYRIKLEYKSNAFGTTAKRSNGSMIRTVSGTDMRISSPRG